MAVSQREIDAAKLVGSRGGFVDVTNRSAEDRNKLVAARNEAAYSTKK